MKDISVIIPVYNTLLDKLEKCIESVLKLKNKYDIEVLIIDDGSKEYINKFFKENQVGSVCDRKNQLGALKLLLPFLKEDKTREFIYAGGIIDEDYQKEIVEFAKRRH